MVCVFVFVVVKQCSFCFFWLCYVIWVEVIKQLAMFVYFLHVAFTLANLFVFLVCAGSGVIAGSLNTPLSVDTWRTQTVSGVVDVDIFGQDVPMGSVRIAGMFCLLDYVCAVICLVWTLLPCVRV